MQILNDRLKKVNVSIINDLQHMGNSLSRMGELHGLIGKVYDVLKVDTLTDAHETLGEAFLKLKGSFNELSKVFMNGFVNYFKYQKYQLSSIEELLKAWTQTSTAAESTELKLKQKKEFLFDKKLIGTWDLDKNCHTGVDLLLSNKGIAFREMLPEETNLAYEQKLASGFYANKIIEEFIRINNKDDYNLKKHFIIIAKKCCDIFEEIDVMWADMVAHFTGIKDNVDPNDKKIVKAWEELPENTFEKKARLEAMKNA